MGMGSQPKAGGCPVSWLARNASSQGEDFEGRPCAHVITAASVAPRVLMGSSTPASAPSVEAGVQPYRFFIESMSRSRWLWFFNLAILNTLVSALTPPGGNIYARGRPSCGRRAPRRTARIPGIWFELCEWGTATARAARPPGSSNRSSSGYLDQTGVLNEPDKGAHSRQAIARQRLPIGVVYVAPFGSAAFGLGRRRRGREETGARAARNGPARAVSVPGGCMSLFHAGPSIPRGLALV